MSADSLSKRSAPTMTFAGSDCNERCPGVGYCQRVGDRDGNRQHLSSRHDRCTPL
jgi:hypothetical protein